MVHQPQSHGKGKAKQNQNDNKSNQTSIFKKKKKEEELEDDEGCFVCGSPDHWVNKCPNRKERKPRPKQKDCKHGYIQL
jgi:hypothetical protein